MTFDVSAAHIIFLIFEAIILVITYGICAGSDCLFDPIDTNDSLWVVPAFMFLTGVVYEIAARNINGIIVLSGFGCMLLQRIIPTVIELRKKRKNHKRNLEKEKFKKFCKNVSYIIEKSENFNIFLDEGTIMFLRYLQHLNSFESEPKLKKIAEVIEDTTTILMHYMELINLNIATESDSQSLRKSFDLLTKIAVKYGNEKQNAFKKSIKNQQNSLMKLWSTKNTYFYSKCFFII